MYGYENSIELLGDALCDLGELSDDLVDDIISGDTACSPALVKLGEILREYKRMYESREIPELKPIFIDGLDEQIEAFLDRKERIESVKEQFK